MYARMVTSYVKPNKLDAMTAVYRNRLLPLIKRQPGFKGIFVLTGPEVNKEVSITLWEKLVDMEAFNVNLLALKDEIASLLASGPEVEIFQVVVPEDPRPTDIFPISEMSLGVRIETPFSKEVS